MSILSEVAVAALGVAGFCIGIALSYIAPEELKAGKEYFKYFRLSLFVLISIFIIYSLYSRFLTLIPLFFVIFAVLLLLDLKLKSRISYLFHYLAFLGGYYFIEDKIFLAALLFLYGFPAGTSWRIKDE